jgi:excisionase family DNA binding protein
VATISGDMFSIADVAAALRLSDRTIRRHIKSGRLHARMIGGVWRISGDDVLLAFGVRIRKAS